MMDKRERCPAELDLSLYPLTITRGSSEKVFVQRIIYKRSTNNPIKQTGEVPLEVE